MSIQVLLVTGATGETGRYTVRHLLEKGHTVRVVPVFRREIIGDRRP